VSVLIVPYTKRRQAERLLASANLDVEWSGPPSADEIRARDQVRLLEDPILTEAASEEDLVLARRILADRSPEAVAAALIRLHRSRLPEPEEIFDDVRDRGPDVRPPRLDRQPRSEGPSDTAWFRLPIGRTNNADPKWLIPLICRLGHVTKKEIGLIRIFDRETKFEISREVEARFREATRAAGAAGDMRIEPAGAPGVPPPGADRAPKRRGPPPKRTKPKR
jgi:ATP-dependent RNA helicase DeaD